MIIRKIQLYRFVLLTIFTMVAFSGTASASLITPEKVVDLVNKERIKQGLSALIFSASLSQAAEYKAKDMVKNDYFAHTSPSGLTPWHWVEKSGYDYKYAGENLAIGFDSAEKQQDAWMKSESHRKNILNVNYRDIGVAVKEGKIDGEDTLLAVQIFGAPKIIPAAKKEEPAVLPEPETAVLPAEAASPEVPQVENIIGLKNKFIESDLGIYAMAGALAGVGYLTVLNFMILVFLATELKRKTLQTEKYQILYTVSAEEYEDLMRNFKARARGAYQAHFDKIHLKLSS